MMTDKPNLPGLGGDSFPTEGSTVYTLSSPTGIYNPDGSAQMQPVAVAQTLKELLMLGSQNPSRPHVITQTVVLLVHNPKVFIAKPPANN